MPNQRAPGKRQIGVFFDSDEYKLIEQIANETGEYKADVVRRMVDEYLRSAKGKREVIRVRERRHDYGGRDDGQ